MVRLYAALCVLGALLPLFFFASFVADEGLDPQEFVDQMTRTDISLFAWADVVVAGLVVLVFTLVTRPPRWALAALGHRSRRALARPAFAPALAGTRTYV